MTPKQNAKELVKKFRMYSFTTDYDYAENGAENEYYNAVKCALICVDEILDNIVDENGWNIDYWNDVKTEIKKI